MALAKIPDEVSGPVKIESSTLLDDYAPTVDLARDFKVSVRTIERWVR